MERLCNCNESPAPAPAPPPLKKLNQFDFLRQLNEVVAKQRRAREDSINEGTKSRFTGNFYKILKECLDTERYRTEVFNFFRAE